MKLIYLTLLVCLMVIVAVSAVPVEEGLGFDGEYESDNYNPQDAQQFFKLKKLKKLLFG